MECVAECMLNNKKKKKREKEWEMDMIGLDCIEDVLDFLCIY